MAKDLSLNYGIGESYIPKIYVNKIIIDDISETPKYDKTVLKYIDEESRWIFMGGTGGGQGQTFVGSKETGYWAPASFAGPGLSPNSKGVDLNTYFKKFGPQQEGVRITYKTSILFPISNANVFKEIYSDEDFVNNVKCHFYYFWTDNSSATNPIKSIKDWTGINGEKNMALFKLNDFTDSGVWDAIKNVGLSNGLNSFSHDEFSLKEVLNPLLEGWPQAVDLAIADTDIAFQKYKKSLPDGTVYFEIPYTIIKDIPTSKPNAIENLKILTFAKVEDFELDFTFNIADVHIDMDFNFSDFQHKPSSGGKDTDFLGLGPWTLETVIQGSKPQRTGMIFTISDNQSSNLSTGKYMDFEMHASLKREDNWNDLKGTPWLGSVHLEKGKGSASWWQQWVGGPTKVNKSAGSDAAASQPYLDVHYIETQKISDVRGVKKIAETNIDLSSLKVLAKVGNIKYKNNQDESHILDRKTYFSEFLLTPAKNGAINGFFGIDYLNILKNNSMFPALLDKIVNDKDSLGLIGNTLTVLLKKSIQIIITRHEVNHSARSKIIFDSDGMDKENLYPKQMYDAPAFGEEGPENPPRGYLRALNLSTDLLDNTGLGLYEFFTFTDLDTTKKFNTLYKYEIEISFEDPLVSILGELMLRIRDAIKGIPAKYVPPGVPVTDIDKPVFGLKQLAYLVDYKTFPSNPKSLDNIKSPYIMDSEIVSAPELKINPVSTFDMVLAVSPKSLDVDSGVLHTVKNIFKEKILNILLKDNARTYGLGAVGSTGKSIDPASLEADVLNSIAIKDESNVSLDNITLTLNMFQALYTNLKSILDAVTIVNYSKNTTASEGGINVKGKAPGNVAGEKRKLTVKKTFNEYVQITDYGLNYPSLFNNYAKPFPATLHKPIPDASNRMGLKVVTKADYVANMKSVLLTYYNEKAVENLGPSKGGFKGEILTIAKPIDPSPGAEFELPQPSMNGVGYSFLPLSMYGVQLPEYILKPPAAGKRDWHSLIQTLVLFNKENYSRYSIENMRSGGKQKWNASLFENENVEQNKAILKMAISVEKNQQLLWSLGLATSDTITDIITNEAAVENGELGTQFPVDVDFGYNVSVPIPEKVTSTDWTKNYFMSYVNNLAQNRLALWHLNPPGPWLVANQFLAPINQLHMNMPVHTISLTLMAQQKEAIKKGELPPPNVLSPEFNTIYSSVFVPHMSSPDAMHPPEDGLRADRLMEYYFKFFHCVEVFYLTGFDTYNAEKLAMNSDPYSDSTLDIFETKANVSINSLTWERLTWYQLVGLEKDQNIICKIDNYSSGLFDADIEAVLRSFPKYDKYFIVSGGDYQGMVLNEFGDVKK